LGSRLERLHGLTATGKTIFNLAYDAFQSGFYAVGVHRAALHTVLWQGFERSGAGFHANFDTAGIETLSGGRLSLVTQDGRKSAAYDLVIDSSGARSPIRSWVARKEARPFTYGAVWATVPDKGVLAAALAQRYVDAHIMVGHMPIGRLHHGGPSLAALFWSLKPDDHGAWKAGFDRWKDDVLDLWPQLDATIQSLSSPDDFTLASYVHFSSRRLCRDNVVLTGDAAHCTSPQLGQGANQAMIDAVVLADAIAASDDLATAFRLYAAARRRHVSFYQYASALMTPFFQSDSKLLSLIRDLGFDRMKLVPYLHAEMIRTLAGLKTGLFTSSTPEAIVNAIAPDRVLPIPARNAA
jgi:2-polyprenyl-6-methoxyphenol hydroxylase-like FAD-dependent oxidoreductase